MMVDTSNEVYTLKNLLRAQTLLKIYYILRGFGGVLFRNSNIS